jgi:hypothetical protein
MQVALLLQIFVPDDVVEYEVSPTSDGRGGGGLGLAAEGKCVTIWPMSRRLKIIPVKATRK